VKYEKPQVAALPDALESILAGSLMKTALASDGPGSHHITVAAYASDEESTRRRGGLFPAPRSPIRYRSLGPCAFRPESSPDS
jgi:hypothetical protein